MKLSANLACLLAALFAVFCFAYAGFGFSSIDAAMSAEDVENARGYAWFWLFLGGVGVVIAVLSRWMAVADGGGDT
jgi:hypothetical protein